MKQVEGWVLNVGYLCHPDDPDLPDCYSQEALTQGLTGWRLDEFLGSLQERAPQESQGRGTAKEAQERDGEIDE